jgi:phosphoribosyl 1,2-cyclic phosphodiesterase
MPDHQQKAITMTVLGSGSGGNCVLVETARTRVLVDAGFSGMQIRKRLEAMGRSLEEVQAVLVTHEHIDHVAGLKVLAGRLGLPVYCNEQTREFLRGDLAAYEGWKLFRSGDAFMVGDLEVESFPVPHDAYDPVAFTLAAGGRKVGILTDLGYATRLAVEKVRGCDALLLEANYDLDLLRLDGKRPWSVKQRIQSRHGHLSNQMAAEVALEVAGDRLRHLFLGHLSQDCNRPELARAVVEARLAGAGVTDVTVLDTRQDGPVGPLAL